ncbi:MarR family winged helix-turn-helix transcriptional regulator [Rhodococcus koreensis]
MDDNLEVAVKEVVSAAPAQPETVDWLTFARDHRDDGNTTMFMAMRSVMRLQQHVTSVLERELKEHFGMNLTDFLMLKTLQMSDDGTRLLSRVAWHLLVHATTVTIATDRLEARGLLYRHTHPRDRRARCVTITEEGRAVVDSATEKLSGCGFGMTGLDAGTARTLVELLAPVRRSAGDLDRSH